MLPVIVAFALGVAVGILYTRFRAASGEREPETEIRPPRRGRIEGEPAPNRKARKAGLTEADFTPSDDILERLRRVEAGELDPAALHADDGEATPEPEPESPAEPGPAPLDPAAMSDAERRVFDRLQRMARDEPADD